MWGTCILLSNGKKEKFQTECCLFNTILGQLGTWGKTLRREVAWFLYKQVYIFTLPVLWYSVFSGIIQDAFTTDRFSLFLEHIIRISFVVLLMQYLFVSKDHVILTQAKQSKCIFSYDVGSSNKIRLQKKSPSLWEYGRRF